jgi:hypothetical protein
LRKETKQLFYQRTVSNYVAKPKLKCPAHYHQICVPQLKQHKVFCKKVKCNVCIGNRLNLPEDTSLYKEIPL